MRQLGVRVLNAALIGLCSFQVAGVFNRIAAEGLRSAPRYAVAAPATALSAGSAWNDRKIILDRNLFGAQIVGQPSVLEPVEPVEETKLPLVLEATIAATGESFSRAAIRDSRSLASMVLGVGDPVTGHSGVSVAVIERGRVVLLNAGRHEELLLDEGSPSVSPPRQVTPRRRGRKPASTPRKPRLSRSNPGSRAITRGLSPPVDSPELSELTRRLQSGALTREQLSESIRRQISSGELSTEQFGEMLGELADQDPELLTEPE